MLMAQINVRNLEDWVVASFRERAERNGRSLEAELREALRDEALRTRRRIAVELKDLRERMAQQYGPLADTTSVLRQTRDAE
jgi:plasmid stability protein